MKTILTKLVPAVILVVGLFAWPATVLGQGAPAERVAGPLAEIGKGLWLAQISCWNCHGNMANGRNDDPRSPQGPNLRETFLNVEQLAETIRCGRPGTPMPSFGRNPYTGNNTCYGLTAEALGANLPPVGTETLNARQLDALAQFITFQFVGMGPATQEECRALFGATASSCNRWPTAAEAAAAAAAPAAPAPAAPAAPM